MDIKDIKILINEVSNSNLYEFRYEENGVKLQLSKGTIYDEKKTVAITDAKTTATILRKMLILLTIRKIWEAVRIAVSSLKLKKK